MVLNQQRHSTRIQGSQPRTHQRTRQKLSRKQSSSRMGTRIQTTSERLRLHTDHQTLHTGRTHRTLRRLLLPLRRRMDTARSLPNPRHSTRRTQSRQLRSIMLAVQCEVVAHRRMTRPKNSDPAPSKILGATFPSAPGHKPAPRYSAHPSENDSH